MTELRIAEIASEQRWRAGQEVSIEVGSDVAIGRFMVIQLHVSVSYHGKLSCEYWLRSLSEVREECGEDGS